VALRGARRATKGREELNSLKSLTLTNAYLNKNHKKKDKAKSKPLEL
jgi:hypothetical protein